MPDDVDPGTTEDLVHDALIVGERVTPRLITDWISRGLLDHPARRGAGRGQGSQKAVFSGHQRRLFRLLIDKRRETREISQLAKIPVYLWAYWGDQYAPLRQAKRAMATSVAADRQPSKPRAKAAASNLVTQISHPDASATARNRGARLLEKTIYAGRVGDRAVLTDALAGLVDPKRAGRQIGPPGASVDATTIARTALLRELAITALLQDSIPDPEFETARDELRHSMAEYLANIPTLAAQAGDSATLFHAPTPDELVQATPSHLLLVLGRLRNPELT